MKIDFSAGSPKAIKKKITKHFDKVRKEIKESLADVYGARYLSDKMFEDGNVFDYDASSNSKEGHVNHSGPLAKALAEVYVKAWDKYYAEVQKNHRSKVSLERYEPHLRRKNEGRDGDPPHTKGKYYPSQPSSATYSIWSGLFYDSVSTAFRDGGSVYMEVGNYLIQSSWDFKKESYPDPYFKETRGIHDYMVKNAGVDDTDIVPFPKADRANVKNLMATAARAGFVNPVKEILSKISFKI